MLGSRFDSSDSLSYQVKLAFNHFSALFLNDYLIFRALSTRQPNGRKIIP